MDIFTCNGSHTFALLCLKLQRVKKLSYLCAHLVDVVIQIQKGFRGELAIFLKFPVHDCLDLFFKKHDKGLFLGNFFTLCLFSLLVHNSFEVVFELDFFFFSVFHGLEKGFDFNEEMGAIWAGAEDLEEVLV